MINIAAMFAACCCFMISVLTVFLTYYNNKTVFDNNKGAVAGLWLILAFFTITIIISLGAGFVSQHSEYTPMGVYSPGGYGTMGMT